MAGKSSSEELISFQLHLLSLHAKNGEYCVLWEVSDNIVTISNSFELGHSDNNCKYLEMARGFVKGWLQLRLQFLFTLIYLLTTFSQSK